MGSADDWERPTKPERIDPAFQLGALIREMVELRDRVSLLEGMMMRRRSIRPTLERSAGTVIIAGIVAGIVQALAQVFR